MVDLVDLAVAGAAETDRVERLALIGKPLADKLWGKNGVDGLAGGGGASKHTLTLQST